MSLRFAGLSVPFALIAIPGVLTAQGMPLRDLEDRPLRTAELSTSQGPTRAKTDPRKINLKVTDSTLKYVTFEIAKQAGLRLVSYGTGPLTDLRVTVSLVNADTKTAFATALKGTGLVATISDDYTTVVLRRQESRPDTGEVRRTGRIEGRVIDSAKREGVQGATVQVVGTNVSAVTDAKGTFVLSNISAGAHTISIRLIGFKTQQVPVTIQNGSSTPLTAILIPSAASLTEVVTTATGVQRKVEIGSAISSINVDSVMRVAPVTTLTDLLESRVPGLTVQRASGTPGEPSRIRIRGSSSMERNNEPIVIVDGVRVYGDQSAGLGGNISQTGATARKISGPLNDGNAFVNLAPSPFDQIDPNTIETIDVFKGPSASAMYGSDAANGVIVITTKRGRVGASQWRVTANTSILQLPGDYPMGTYLFGHSIAQSTFSGESNVICRRADLLCVVDSIRTFQALNRKDLTPIGRGIINNVSTTINGGYQAIQYSATASVGRQLGMLKLPDMEARQFTEKFAQQPFHWLRRPERYNTWGVTGTMTGQPGGTRITISSSLFSSMQQRSSLSNAIKTLSSTYLDESTPLVGTLLHELYRRIHSSNLKSNNSVDIAWSPLSWLPITTTVGLNTNVRFDETFIPPGMVLQTSFREGKYALGRGQDQTKTFSTRTTIPFNPLRLTIATGFTANAQSVGLLRSDVDALPAGQLLPTIFTRSDQTTRSGNTFGWFVEPRLNLTSRFFVMPGLRLDNNGLAGRGAGVMGMPKMSFSWLASDESFFPLKDYIGLFRLRAAFGAAGIQPGPADRVRTYQIQVGTTIENQYFTTTVPGGQYMSLGGLGNTQLRPERSVEIEGGFDTDLWKNRFTLEVTAYRKHKRDAIISVPLAPSVAASNVKLNIGEVENTGFEISSSLRAIETKNVAWTTRFSVSRDNNKVLRLNEGQLALEISDGSPVGTATRIVPGYPLFGRWVRPIIGYADLNENGILEKGEVRVGDSMVYVGRQEPVYSLNASSDVVLFGRITVNAAVDYEHGVSQINQLMNDPISPFGANRNSPIGSQVAYAGVDAGTPYGFIQTVSTFRFNTLSLGWNAPPGFLPFLRTRTTSLTVQGQNLAMKTNYKGKDPKVGASPTSNTIVDNGQMPLPRTLVLRVQVGN